MNAKPIGVGVMPLDNRRATLVGIASIAERLGYSPICCRETWAHDVTVLMAEVGDSHHSASRWARASSGVWAGAPARSRWRRAEPLRGVVRPLRPSGLSASTAQLTEGLHDVPFVAPLAKMRRTVTPGASACLGGERVPLAVATGARPLKLNLTPSGAVPIFLAALTDESVRLAGELADGWLPFLYPRRCLARGLGSPREGAARSADAGRRVSVYPTVPTVGGGRPGRSARGRGVVRVVLPDDDGAALPAVARPSGIRPARSTAVIGANAPEFAGGGPARGDWLLEELTALRHAGRSAERLGQWHAAGADMPPGVPPSQPLARGDRGHAEQRSGRC